MAVTSNPRIAVYTCITGNYDTLAAPSQVDSRVSYLCFSDNGTSPVGPWQHRPIGRLDLSPKDQNRHVKMHPHEWLPEFDVTVYVDGNVHVVGDVFALVTEALRSNADVLLYDHFDRKCVFAEAAACAHFSHDWVWTIARQMRRYSREGYPVDNGLFDASVIVRRNTPSVRALMEAWWTEYQYGAKRDQLSLPVVARRTGVALGTLGLSDARFTHRYFRFVNHPKRRSVKLMVRKYINRSVASVVPYQRLFRLTQPLVWR